MFNFNHWAIRGIEADGILKLNIIRQGGSSDTPQEVGIHAGAHRADLIMCKMELTAKLAHRFPPVNLHERFPIHIPDNFLIGTRAHHARRFDIKGKPRCAAMGGRKFSAALHCFEKIQSPIQLSPALVKIKKRGCEIPLLHQVPEFNILERDILNPGNERGFKRGVNPLTCTGEEKIGRIKFQEVESSLLHSPNRILQLHEGSCGKIKNPADMRDLLLLAQRGNIICHLLEKAFQEFPIIAGKWSQEENQLLGISGKETFPSPSLSWEEANGNMLHMPEKAR